MSINLYNFSTSVIFCQMYSKKMCLCNVLIVFNNNKID